MDSASDIESSPLNPRKAETLRQNVSEVKHEEFRAKSEEDMRTRYVKASSVEEFLDTLLPYRPRTNQRPHHAENPFEDLRDADSWAEAKVVERFAEAVTTHRLCPRLAFRRSEHRPHSKATDKMQQRIDAGLFRLSEAPDDGRPHWELQLVAVEFKSRSQGNKYDPFADGDVHGILKLVAEVLEPDTLKSTAVRAQMISYGGLISAMQHRTFVFMLLVIGRRFRLIRWDRSGAIVTSSVDYYDNPDPLCEFLWRISFVKPVALGVDPTATRLRPNSPEFETMTAIANDTSRDLPYHQRAIPLNYKLPERYWFTYVRDMFASSLKNPDWPRYRLEVVCDGEIFPFLVGEPVFCVRGMAGRGTRGYVAYDLKHDRLVWLKDTWRASYDLLEKEGDILQRLNDSKLDIFVPTVLCHGDVPYQATLSADWWEHKHPADPPTSPLAPPLAPPRQSSRVTLPTKRKRQDNSPVNPIPNYRPDCPLRHHQHYRMVVKEVCMPLKDFCDGQQLVALLSDCVYTHEQVATQLGLLHRDISDNNILIYPEIHRRSDEFMLLWHGYLADWELAKAIAPSSSYAIARQPERTGTWHFLSVNLINNRQKLVTIPDELESLLHILIHYSVRYLRSNIDEPDSVAEFLDATYDTYTVGSGEICCGERKATMVTSSGALRRFQPKLSRNVPIEFNSPMDHLISQMLQSFKAHYQLMNAEALGCSSETSPEVEALAERVRTHAWMRNVFELTLEDLGWDHDSVDKVGDRVPLGWASNRKTIPTMLPTRKAKS